MTIQQWPEHERPRERLIQRGANTLSDAELLAIFLRTGLPGKSAVDLARDMIQAFGGLQNLHKVPLREWLQVKGLGQAKYAQLQACLEMARRCLSGELNDTQQRVNSPERFERFARAHIGLSTVEQFLVIALDSQLKVIQHRVLFSGTVNKTAVFPREVLKFALDCQASRVLVAHNHPSDCCNPSAADDKLTLDLCAALRLVDLELIDHLIVGKSCVFSYRQSSRNPF
ncbi:DNA repair protein RadC [Limnobacter humi]|uniref:DNA repair protein RadC n=1 Tax=Limnobacter humi TaxID=1778671 RepID=A0ABT1WG67_9BURK|nr:DNA repair protein RadC [Limnobacter humi]MCQ8896515.1 DNA repair protein RadC [Limnobacter humi]